VHQSESRAALLRQPFYIWIAGMTRTMLAILRGDPDAERQARAVCELATAGGQLDAPAAFAAQLNDVRMNQGRAAEMIEPLRALIDAMPHIPSWRAGLARASAECDRLDDVRELIEPLRAAQFDHPLDWSWGSFMVCESDAACALGDTGAAAVLYERLRPVAAQVHTVVVAIGSVGSYSLWCGALAACLRRWEDAERHFADALAMNERLGARPFVVRTRRAWAAMLLDRDAAGDRARARDLIAAGRAEAERLGMARELVLFERLGKQIDRE
jgi:tetratricopeptide (TPR) repeat protein